MSQDNKDNNITAALSYISILSVIIYILKKDNEYIAFHSKQGMVIFGLSLVGMIPFLGWPIWIISVILMVIGATKAYKGEKYKIPVISEFAEKINF